MKQNVRITAAILKAGAWIDPPVQLTAHSAHELLSAAVDVPFAQVPQGDRFRYTDAQGEPYVQPQQDAERIYGYFYLADRIDDLKDPSPVNAFVELKSAAYFVVGEHTETQGGLDALAATGRLFSISAADFRRLSGPIYSTYLLSELKGEGGQDRSWEDPYLFAKQMQRQHADAA